MENFKGTLPAVQAGSTDADDATCGGVSERKMAANRNNAAKSTGPTSARGKQISRMNALKTGIFAHQLTLAGANHLADFPDFELLLEKLCEHHPPTTLAEEIRLQKIAVDLWRLARAQRFEIVETVKEHAFAGLCRDKVLRYSSLMERVGAAALKMLDELSTGSSAAGTHETDSNSLAGNETGVDSVVSGQASDGQLRATSPDPKPPASEDTVRDANRRRAGAIYE